MTDHPADGACTHYFITTRNKTRFSNLVFSVVIRNAALVQAFYLDSRLYLIR